MSETDDQEVKYLYRTEKAIRGRESAKIAEWKSRGWELHKQETGTLRTTLTFRKVVEPSKVKPWMLIAALLAVGVLGLGGATIADALGSGSGSPESKVKSSQSVPTQSVTPSDTPSEQPKSTPSTGPTPGPPAPVPASGVVTVQNSPDFKRLLRYGEDDAVSQAFAEKYAGRTIKFDGSVSVVSGGRYLVYAGDDSDTEYVPGPAFQFVSLEDGPFRAGENLTFVAEVGGFNPDQSIFHLMSISTSVR